MRGGLLLLEVGHIQGGWSYVWTAYGLTWTALGLYALSLWLRWPKKES